MIGAVCGLVGMVVRVENGDVEMGIMGGLVVRVKVHDRDRPVLAARVGSPQSIVIRSVSGEHDFDLYGFLDLDDRAAFDELMKIEGIGAKVALRILSQLDHKALRTASVPALTRCHGVGAKTAAKIHAALRGEGRT
jgi:Holliday junction resolvasome RuvABC DNA-binding subunit